MAHKANHHTGNPSTKCCGNTILKKINGIKISEGHLRSSINLKEKFTLKIFKSSVKGVKAIRRLFGRRG
jgi:hypothetical protein